MVVSSLMDGAALHELLDQYDYRVIGESRMFFEKLSVVEIRDFPYN